MGRATILLGQVMLLLALFEAAYALPRGRQLQTAKTANTITDLSGGATQGEIDKAGGKEWFKFTAEAGKTYQIETRLGSLDDTMIELINTGALS